MIRSIYQSSSLHENSCDGDIETLSALVSAKSSPQLSALQAGMDVNSNNAGSSHSQQIYNFDADPMDLPTSNIGGRDNHAVESQEEAKLRSVLENHHFNLINEIFLEGPSLLYNASHIKNGHGDSLLHATVAATIVNAELGIRTREALLASGVDLGTQTTTRTQLSTSLRAT